MLHPTPHTCYSTGRQPRGQPCQAHGGQRADSVRTLLGILQTAEYCLPRARSCPRQGPLQGDSFLCSLIASTSASQGSLGPSPVPCRSVMTQTPPHPKAPTKARRYIRKDHTRCDLPPRRGPGSRATKKRPPQILLEAREGGIPGTEMLGEARVKKSRAPRGPKQGGTLQEDRAQGQRERQINAVGNVQPQRVPQVRPPIIGGASPTGQGLPCAQALEDKEQRTPQPFWNSALSLWFLQIINSSGEGLAATMKGCFPPPGSQHRPPASPLILGSQKVLGFKGGVRFLKSRLLLATYSTSCRLI